MPVKTFSSLCLSLIFFLFNCSVSEAQKNVTSDKIFDPVVLQLKWFHQFQFAGYYAALHKGFFRDEGLDVTIKAGGPQVNVDEEVTSGRANFGVLASELIPKKANGEPLVLLAVILQHSIRAIIVRTDSGIHSPADLIGRKMMINRNEDTEFMAMFIAEGIPVDRLNIIPKDETANDKFINGDVDALNGSIGNQPFLFQSKGISVTTIRPISYGIDFYGDSLFTSDAELKNHRERAEAFRRATLRGWEYAMAHTGEIIDLIIAEYASTKTRAQLQFEADAIRKLILPELVDIGHVNHKRIERIARIYAEQNIIPQNYSLDGFVYEPSPVSNGRLIRKLIIGFFVLIGIMSLCGAILIVFNKRLKKLIVFRTQELSQANEKLTKEVEIRKRAENSLRKLVESTVGSTGQDLYDKIVLNLCELFGCDIAIVSEIEGTSKSKSLSMAIDGKINRDYSFDLTGTPCGNAAENGFCVYPESVCDLFPADKDLKDMQAVGYVGTPLTDDDGTPIGILCALSRSKLDLPKEAEGLIKIMAARASAEIQRQQSEKLKVATEIKLRQAQKMEAIGILAGGIAHDFNNILGAILGYADLARDDTPSDSTVARYLDQILTACYRARDLVKQILAFSRKSEAECVLFQPSSTIKEAIKMLRPSLPTTIEIHEDIDPMSGVIFADPTQLHQILINLCTNAFHAMEETGGNLFISLKNKDICVEDFPDEQGILSGKYVELTVRDSGPGIAANIVERIFDPYFTTKESGKGTGMGLAIVYGIVKNCKGTITVENNPGIGVAFHVFFPVTESNITPETDSTEAIPVGKERILIVDDEKILADMGKSILERLGYTVTVRDSSLDALKTFQNQPDQFDLVITDQTMPGMTGAELATRMLQIKPDLPIILCTGYSTIMSDEKAKAIGIKEFAFKPLVKSDIAKLVRKALDGNESL